MALIFKDFLIVDGEMEQGRYTSLRVEEGRIAALGDDLTAMPGDVSISVDASISVDEVIAGERRMALVPGFVNAHTHAAMSLLRGLGEEKPLMEWLQQRIWPIEAKLKREHVYWGTLSALMEMAACGTTAFADMYFEMDAVVEAALESGMRCGASRGIVGDDKEKLEEALRLADTWKDHRDSVSVQLAPHAPYTVPVPMVQEIAALAAERNLGVHFHFLEAEWELSYLRDELKMTPEQYLETSGLLSAPHGIFAHCVWLDPSVIEQVDFSRITIAHNPNSNLKLGSGVMDLTGISAHTKKIALGTDGAASNNRLDIWGEMRFAALLHKGIRKDPTVLSARDALRMATLEGAAALGFEKKGLLREGWAADFVLVDLDQPQYVGIGPENAAQFLVYAGSSSDVYGTMVGGNWIYRDRVFPALDGEKIMAQCASIREYLVQ